MPRTVKHVSDMEIDEISLVDRPANQHALVTIAKRAPEEETVPEYFYEDGSAVDLDALEIGDVVFDADGNGFEYAEDETEEDLSTNAGVSKAFDRQPTGFAASVREALSKAVNDTDRDAIITKALESVETLQKGLEQATEIAKSERTLRLEREYIAKAAEYNVPIDADQLGPVLMRCAEALSYEDCAVINKALSASGGMIYEEIGYIGQGEQDDDPMARVEAYATERVSKAAGQDGLSKAQSVADYFAANPAEYDAYKANMAGQR